MWVTVPFELVEASLMTPFSNRELKEITAINPICSKLCGLEDRSYALLTEGGQPLGDERCPHKMLSRTIKEALLSKFLFLL